MQTKEKDLFSWLSGNGNLRKQLIEDINRIESRQNVGFLDVAIEKESVRSILCTIRN